MQGSTWFLINNPDRWGISLGQLIWHKSVDKVPDYYLKAIHRSGFFIVLANPLLIHFFINGYSRQSCCNWFCIRFYLIVRREFEMMWKVTAYKFLFTPIYDPADNSVWVTVWF